MQAKDAAGRQYPLPSVLRRPRHLWWPGDDAASLFGFIGFARHAQGHSRLSSFFHRQPYTLHIPSHATCRAMQGQGDAQQTSKQASNRV